MKRKICYTTGCRILLAIFLIVLCQAPAKAVTRSEALGNTTFYTNVFFSPQRDTVTIINSTGRNFGLFTSFFPKNNTQIGEAYVWGGTDDYYTFLNKITSNISAGGYYTSTFGTDTNQYWVPEVSSSGSLASHYLTGIDCGVFANRCLGLNPYQGIAALQKCSQQITIDEMKPGDLCVIPHHVALNAEGSGSWIVHSVSSASYGPPKVQQGVWDQGWGVFTPYSIFPQFSGIYPPPDTTINPGETVTIQLQTEGTKPSHKDNVVAEINNIQIWLDDSLVIPSASGPKNRQTIKYKVDSLDPGKHRVKVQCDNVVNGIAYMDTVAWEFKVKDERPGWINCTDNSNDIPEYIVRITVDPPTEFITPMDSIYWDEHLFYTEMSDTMWVWNGSLQNVSELKSLSIWGICPQSIYKVILPTQPTPKVVYMEESRSDYSEPVSWPSVEILVDGVTLPVTFSEAKALYLYENPFGSVNLYDTTYVFWLRNINWSASDAGIKNPQSVTVKVKPTIIVDPVDGERVGMQVFNYPPDLIGDYFTQYIRQPCMVGYDGTGALIPYIGDSTTTAALASGSRSENKNSKSKQTDNTTSFRVNDLYPNPAGKFTTMEFTISQNEKVELKIYNLAGQLVKVLINENMAAGKHQCSWDGRDESGLKVSQGVYLYKIKAGKYSDNKKLIWLK